jgi:hypothetical protein
VFVGEQRTRGGWQVEMKLLLEEIHLPLVEVGYMVDFWFGLKGKDRWAKDAHG